jgi:hypothetical protein
VKRWESCESEPKVFLSFPFWVVACGRVTITKPGPHCTLSNYFITLSSSDEQKLLVWGCLGNSLNEMLVNSSPIVSPASRKDEVELQISRWYIYFRYMYVHYICIFQNRNTSKPYLQNWPNGSGFWIQNSALYLLFLIFIISIFHCFIRKNCSNLNQRFVNQNTSV